MVLNSFARRVGVPYFRAKLTHFARLSVDMALPGQSRRYGGPGKKAWIYVFKCAFSLRTSGRLSLFIKERVVHPSWQSNFGRPLTLSRATGSIADRSGQFSNDLWSPRKSLSQSRREAEEIAGVAGMVGNVPPCHSERRITQRDIDWVAGTKRSTYRVGGYPVRRVIHLISSCPRQPCNG